MSLTFDTFEEVGQPIANGLEWWRGWNPFLIEYDMPNNILPNPCQMWLAWRPCNFYWQRLNVSALMLSFPYIRPSECQMKSAKGRRCLWLLSVKNYINLKKIRCVPFRCTTMGQKCIKYRATKCWSNMKPEFKTCTKMEQLRRRLRTVWDTFD